MSAVQQVVDRAKKNFLLPTPGRIVVEEKKAPDQIGRIIVPDTAKRKSTIGTVLAIGFDVLIPYTEAAAEPDDPDQSPKPVFLKVGDKVMYAQMSGTGMWFKGIDMGFRVLSQEEVLGVVVSDDEEMEGFAV